MVISELIKKLEALKEKQGDCEVISGVKEDGPLLASARCVTGASAGCVETPTVFGSPSKTIPVVLLHGNDYAIIKYVAR
jgi:hypothetical protein